MPIHARLFLRFKDPNKEKIADVKNLLLEHNGIAHTYTILPQEDLKEFQ
jgi:hypothetical protein